MFVSLKESFPGSYRVSAKGSATVPSRVVPRSLGSGFNEEPEA